MKGSADARRARNNKIKSPALQKPRAGQPESYQDYRPATHPEVASSSLVVPAIPSKPLRNDWFIQLQPTRAALLRSSPRLPERAAL